LEYESVAVCIGINETREVFEISAFGGDRLYRIIYANVLYFIVIHGGPLLLIAFFNVKLIQTLKRRQRRWAEMGKSWYQQDVSVVLVVVMCVFIICQTPTFVDHILHSARPVDCDFFHAPATLHSLCYCSANCESLVCYAIRPRVVRE